jgi:predicted transposase/invertase (TIGR01784 family)
LKYDATSKESIKAITEDIGIYLLNIEIKDIEFIDKELFRIEKREADIVATCLINGEASILHLEIQNSNDKDMANRMLRYRLDIMNAHSNLPIRQYVIYTGKDKLNMPNSVTDVELEFNYTILDMHQIDCEKFIKMDTPDALVLTILCDFKSKDEKDVVFYIMTRLSELTKGDNQAFGKYMGMLETLSENRNLQKIIKEVEAMLSDIKVEQLPSYELGMERGIERGIERGVEMGKLDGIREGELKSAFIMLDFGIKPEEIAEKLNIPLEKLLRKD